MTLLYFVLHFLIPASSVAQEIIHFHATNKSLFRDVKNVLHFAAFFRHESKFLNVTPLMYLLVPNKKKCQVWCVKDFKCLSINVGVFPESDGKLECELLDTDLFSMDLEDDVNYNHYSIKTGCHDKPCKDNERCHPNYKNNTYSCQCKPPYYGDNCDEGCDSPLGMQDRRISDSQITAASTYSADASPYFARLNETRGYGCWSASTVYNQYLQIDLSRVMTIANVATQARVAYPGGQWVSGYTLKYSTDKIAWTDYENLHGIKEFSGNTDGTTVVTNALEIPIKARYVRIVVTKFHAWVSMRAELYGC